MITSGRLPYRDSVCCWSVLLILVLAPGLQAEVQLPAVFSDHMVLQRDLDVPIWGQAAANEEIRVQFREQSKTTKADDQGRWLLRLDPIEAGGPDPLVVQASNTIRLEDVLVGDVWVGSGQSNMAGGTSSYAKNDAVLAELAARSYPHLRLCRGNGGGWQAADETSIPRFSALLFSFGQRLQEDLDVPVGLIVGAVGGTPSGRWLTQEMLDVDAPSQIALKHAVEADSLEQRQAAYERALTAWEQAVEVAKREGNREPRKPSPPVAVGQVRNGRIGDLYEVNIQPVVPFGIRGVLWDQGESGTAIEGLDQFHSMGTLIRGWRRAWGQDEFPFLYVQKPSGGGCAWDQANPVTREADKFEPLPANPSQGGEGGYRGLHIRIMQHPETAMVTARDLGSGVHPINKSGYGQRAAQVALGFAYVQPVEIYGPLYESHTVEGDQLRVKFSHVGKGLAWKHGECLQGFAIAGEDRVFHWADAEIDGDAVILSSEAVAKPIAVRYAWDRRCPWANLFNKDGLPAITFRSDDW